MTRTFGTNEQNDLYIGRDGNLVVLSGLPAIEAACKTATRAQLGEMVLATGQGIPNFQTLWIGTPDYILWQSFLQETLEGVEGVIEVNSLTISISNGVLSYTARIQTQFGQGIVNG